MPGKSLFLVMLQEYNFFLFILSVVYIHTKFSADRTTTLSFVPLLILLS